MKTLQEQYNLLKEGKGNADVFLKSARRLFPEHITNLTKQEDAITILKQKSLLSENFVGHQLITPIEVNKTSFETAFEKYLAEEAKVEEKKTTKEVEDMETAGYDYKDEKNIDNLYGEAFLQGYYAEMKDPKNADKTVDELKEIVAKNMVKDRNFYMKEAAFGVKGIGYEQKEVEEVSGKHKASGYSDKLKKSENKDMAVKENRTSLMDLISESLMEMSMEPQTEEVEDKKEEPKKAPKKKVKKETVDSKLAEIEKQGKIVTMEAQMDAIDELVASKTQRLEMVTEDDDLSELTDKSKIKAMQKEIKDLEKRRTKMDKMYEKMCGKAYVKQEIVDEVEVSEEIED